MHITAFVTGFIFKISCLFFVVDFGVVCVFCVGLVGGGLCVCLCVCGGGGVGVICQSSILTTIPQAPFNTEI